MIRLDRAASLATHKTAPNEAVVGFILARCKRGANELAVTGRHRMDQTARYASELCTERHRMDWAIRGGTTIRELQNR